MQPTNATYPTDSLPMLHDNQTSYNLTWNPNGTGGVNYFSNGTPITREQFATFGQDPGAIEASAAQQYAGTTSSTGTSNTAGGGTTTPDPFAALRAGFNTQKQNIFGTANDAANNQALGLKGNILDFVDSLRQSQLGIDNKTVQNDLAKIQGGRSILDMVGRGIKSGGVLLANRNAGNSSGAEAIARAYGDAGRRQMSQVGNQFALGQNDIQQQQDQLNQSRDTFTNRKYGDSKQQIVGSIVEAARNSLAELDARMAAASLPERIAIEQEKENIKQQVMGHLSQFDQLLADETAKVNPLGQDAAQTKAFGLASAGQAPDSAFRFDSQVPAQFQNSGPFASDLPLFTYGQKRQLA